MRAETFNRYFDKPIPRSTFHDLVKKGKIVPLKGIRGFYKLNDSLRRLGLRDVAKLPAETPARTPEEIIHPAFLTIDPEVLEVFEAPSWLLNVEAIDQVDLHNA